MALIVFDASAVIALLDPADALHVSARREFILVAREDLRIPASALAETLVMPARAGRLEAARTKVRELDLDIVSVGEDVAVEAARLRGQHQRLRLPDALVIATANVLEADTLITGDANWKQISARVRLIA